jgi:signal transduction histidine kinase
VIAYAWFKGKRIDTVSGSARRAIVASIAAVSAVACALTWLVTAGAAMVPPIMVDAMRASSVWHTLLAPPLLVLSVVSIALLLWRRSSVLDLWLLVVLWAWLIETLLLSTTAYRFSLVWYAGRAFGLLSSSFVLLVLLSESTLIYARLAVSVALHNREREARMMTMDALSASIAHDINQPLGAIVTNGEAGLSLIKRSATDVGELRDVLNDIIDDGHRAGEVVASIRSIFTTGPQVRERVEINAVIRDAVAILRAELEAHGISLQLELEAPTGTILANRGQVQQVILNLATNAIDAMAESADRPRILKIASGAGESEGVVVSVIDTGVGVGADAAARIFDPFFTTRAKGTGMGLAICRSLVSNHGGRLWLSPDHSPGAALNFFLPGGDHTARS